MNIKLRPDGRWEFDSGEVRGDRIRRIFETEAQADAFLRKSKLIAKEEGQRTLMDWLAFSANEIAEIIRYRREMIDLQGQADWAKGRALQLDENCGTLTERIFGDALQRMAAAIHQMDPYALFWAGILSFVNLASFPLGDRSVPENSPPDQRTGSARRGMGPKSCNPQGGSQDRPAATSLP